MTDVVALQAFLYRAATGNARVAAMVNAGTLRGGLSRSPDAEDTVLVEFSEGERIKAQRMGRVYELLYRLENSMRELIESTLKEADGLQEWTDAIDPRLLKRAEGRRDQDQAARWHGPRGGTILSYLDFPDLGAIIQDRWEHFEDLLGDRRWADRYFDEMNPTRRALAHTGDLTDLDVQRLEMKVREWLRVVG